MKLSICAVLVLAVSSQAFAFGKKPSPAQQNNSGNVPIIQNEKFLDLTSSQSVQSISIDMAASPVIKIEENAPAFSISLSAAGSSQANVDELLSRTQQSIANNSLRIENRPGLYMCMTSRMNGALVKVQGTCLTEIRIQLPAGMSNLKISLNNVVEHGEMTFDDLIAAIADSQLQTDKQAKIEQFLAQPSSAGRSLTVKQAQILLGDLSFDDDRLNTCRGLSGRISDPQDAAGVADQFNFDSSKQECVALLGR